MPAEHEHEHEPMPEGEEPPPRGVKTMALVRWAILAVSAALAIFMWGAWAAEKLTSGTATTTAAPSPKYHCPMHPQVVSNEPGECPICHMDLVRISVQDAATMAIPDASSPHEERVVVVDDAGPLAFWCPMHEEVRSASAGRCPICKMALEAMPMDAGVPMTMAGAIDPGSIPPGTTPIQLGVDRIQSIGVRTAVAEEGSAAAALRVTAVVQAPEQGAAEVHVRAPGFVEAIHVDQTGKRVRDGQPLLSLYSPEILQAENELLAVRAWGDDGGTPTAARRKLELLGMTLAEIERLVAKREAVRAISVVAPRGGFVTKKNVVLGSYVTPEMTLYEIQDLSHVYVIGDVFLRDLPSVKVGMGARFLPAGRPEEPSLGTIDLVYPLVNAEARTRRVRMQLENRGDRRYVPGDYGTMEITTPSRRAVTIPRDAIVDTGTALYVFVVEPEGRFVPRVVATSTGDGDHVVVIGVRARERVVSGATFLIDSESRLQASIVQTPAAPSPSAAGTAGEMGPSCTTDFDRTKYPDKFAACSKCEQVHRGMGAMVADCKNVIPKPWN